MSGISPEERAHLERANALVGFRRPAEAIVELREGLAAFPDSAWLWAALAQVAFGTDDTEAARDASERALGLDPQMRSAMVVRGNLFLAEDRWTDAIDLAQRLVAAHPDWPTSHANLAYALSYGPPHARPQARAAVERVLELDPDDPDGYRIGSGVLRRLGDIEGARDLLERGLALAPTDERLLLLRATVATGGDAEVVGILTGVLAENPQQDVASSSLVALVWRRLLTVAGVGVLVGPVLGVVLRPLDLVDPLLRGVLATVLTLAAVGVAAAVLFLPLRRKLPRGYVPGILRRDTRARWGYLLTAVGPLALLLVGALPVTAVAMSALVSGVGASLVAIAGAAEARRAKLYSEHAQAHAVSQRQIVRLTAAVSYAAVAIALAPVFAVGPPLRAVALLEVSLLALALAASSLVSSVLAHVQERRARRLERFPVGFTAAMTAIVIGALSTGMLLGMMLVAPRPPSTPPTEPTRFEVPEVDPDDIVIDIPDFDVPEIDIPDIVAPDPEG